MGNGYRLLVVEDDPNLCETLADLLRLSGYEVDTAPDGEGALVILHDAPRPDAILLDLVLPRMGAEGLLHRIDGAVWPRPAVVLMTGMLAGRDGVPADVLVKPFEVEELLSRMARACHAGMSAAAPS